MMLMPHLLAFHGWLLALYRICSGWLWLKGSLDAHTEVFHIAKKPRKLTFSLLIVWFLLAGWLKDSLEAHAEAFHLAKKPRKLTFAPALGVVDLDLEINGFTQPFTVSPVLAALILPFQEKAVFTPAALAAAAAVPLEIVLRKCALSKQLQRVSSFLRTVARLAALTSAASRSRSVSPVLAAPILPFQQKAGFTPAALAAAAGVPLDAVWRVCTLFSDH
jgi:hypothetical protein